MADENSVTELAAPVTSVSPSDGSMGISGPLSLEAGEAPKKLVWKTLKNVRPIPQNPVANAQYFVRQGIDTSEIMRFTRTKQCNTLDFWFHFGPGYLSYAGYDMKSSHDHFKTYEYWRVKEMTLSLGGMPSLVNPLTAYAGNVRASSGSLAIAWINDPDRLLALGKDREKLTQMDRSRIAGRRMVKFDEDAVIHLPVRQDWYFTANSQYKQAAVERRFNSPGGIYIALCGVPQSAFATAQGYFQLKMSATLHGVLEFAKPSVVFLKWLNETDSWPGHSGTLKAGTGPETVAICHHHASQDTVGVGVVDVEAGMMLANATEPHMYGGLDFLVLTFNDPNLKRQFNPQKDERCSGYAVCFSKPLIVTYKYKPLYATGPGGTVPNGVLLDFEYTISTISGGCHMRKIPLIPGYLFEEASPEIRFTHPTRYNTTSTPSL